jgi:hypothetical protein
VNQLCTPAGSRVLTMLVYVLTVLSKARSQVQRPLYVIKTVHDSL